MFPVSPFKHSMSIRGTFFLPGLLRVGQGLWLGLWFRVEDWALKNIGTIWRPCIYSGVYFIPIIKAFFLFLVLHHDPGSQGQLFSPPAHNGS